MEKNNFNKAYIYIVGIFAIGIAISNIISFFSGVGFALIGASLLLFLTISNVLKSDGKKRFGDIFVLIIIEFMLFIVLFFAYDFNINGFSSKFPQVLRNICAIYSIFAIAYVIFRYVSEIKGKRYKFVEYILGNYTPEPKPKKEKKAKLSKAEIKKNKELENGTLAPKGEVASEEDGNNTEEFENISNDEDLDKADTEVFDEKSTQSIDNENNKDNF